MRRTLVDLGEQPLANSYLDEQRAAIEQARYPLHARVCDECLLVQVDDVVPPEQIFSDYAYFSSYSDSWVEHARRFAEWSSDTFSLGPSSLVVEVASNDGYLLRHFRNRGLRVIGIEPAANVAAEAERVGVSSRVEFFGSATAERLVAEEGPADLLVANNVLAHVPDLDDFVRGLVIALRPTGVLSLEVPHLQNLLARCQFDTIYHEHFSYFSLAAAERALTDRGLRVFDVHALRTHGGSLRILAERADGVGRPEGEGLRSTRAGEQATGMTDVATYDDFTPRVERARDEFRSYLESCRRAGLSLAAYGAAAKGNTFLNYCEVGPDDLLLVADRNPSKQGRYLPGSGVPIAGPEALAAARPDRVLILPWNLKDEVAAQLGYVRSWGGMLVVALPELVEFR